MIESCETCRFFYKREQKNQGECRYNPPAANGMVSCFPMVMTDNWCGKYEYAVRT